MNFIWMDLRYAWRAARRSPGVTLAIIAMLALGTGGVTAVFNPIYSQVFAPLPFPHPEQLVIIGGDIPLYNGYFNRFERREELDRIFSNLTTYSPFPSMRITIPDTGISRDVYVVDANEEFFETLGVQPLRGSGLIRDGNRTSFVISNRFWREELNCADDAVGSMLQSEDSLYPIVGIMPETFDFPTGADIWRYFGPGTMASTARQYLGRLRPEISMAQAAEELRSLEFKPGSGLRGNAGPVLQSLKTVLHGDRTPLLLMSGLAAVLFLLLVCAGVMNLLVTQGTRRKSEMAMRLIHGATRRNLVFQLLRETLPLVIAGAVAGAWLSEIASVWLMTQFPALKGGEVLIPVKMAFFTAMVLTVTIIGGLTPALYASGVNLNTYLKSGSDFRRRFFPFSFSLRELLTGGQLSLALALLTGIGLLVSSMIFHVDIPIRWSSRDMVVVRAELPTESNFNSPDAMVRRAIFFQEFQNHLSTTPEVAAAGIFNPIPFSASAVSNSQSIFQVHKRSGKEKQNASVVRGYASPEGFDMLDIRLISGRSFSSVDIANALEFERRSREALNSGDQSAIGSVAYNNVGGVVIINQSLARQFWPGENAVGKIIYDWFSNSYEVVGIVQDFHIISDNKDFIPAVYYPAENFYQNQTFLVKLHSRDFIKDFRQRLSGVDFGFSTIEINPLNEIVSESMANTRLTLQLLGCFALLGIVVAGLGAYATTSLMVAAMNREIGIRMAMGATTWNIFLFVLWRGIRVILIALPVGLFLAWILSRILSGFLFQVKTDDPLSWVISCAVLLAITTIAVLIPALRATRVNPLDAMKNE